MSQNKREIKKGDKVKVSLDGKHEHCGIYLGFDPVFKDTHWVGVTSTTIPNVKLKSGQKYISIFHTKISKIKPL